MSDWQHTLPPSGLRLEIFNHYGQVRRGVSEGWHIRLSDCAHPTQNAIYPTEQVIAWRLEPQGSNRQIEPRGCI